jgi:hypothetical protein
MCGLGYCSRFGGPKMLMRQRCGKRCGNLLKNHSKNAMVPGAGIEPARLSSGDFESPASTNFTTRAARSEALNYGTVAA